MTSVHTILRTAVPAAALALLLTGCGPDNTGDPAVADAGGAGAASGVTAAGGSGGGAAAAADAVSGGSAGAPDPAASSAAPAGGSSGSTGGSGGDGTGTFASPLAAGATGTYTGTSKADLTLVSVVKGGSADALQLGIPAAEQAGRTPYYVTVTYTNRSGGTLSDNFFLQRVRLASTESDSGVLASPTGAGRSVPACDAGARPAPLADGRSQKSCGVYLLPAGTAPTFVRYGGIMDDHPLVWKAS